MCALFYFIATIPTTLYLAYRVAFVQAGARSSEWNRVRTKTAAAGAYRSTALREELEAGAPLWVRLVCASAVVVGMFTLTLVAPATFLFVLVYEGATWATPGIALVGLSSLSAGVMWMWLASSVARHSPTSMAGFVYLYIHYLLAFAVGMAGWGTNVPWVEDAASAWNGLLIATGPSTLLLILLQLARRPVRANE